MKKIIIVLPTFPHYRKEFLNRMSAQLAENDVELIVFHGFTKKKKIQEIEEESFQCISFKTIEYSLGILTFTFLRNLKQKIVEINPDGIVILFNPMIVSFVEVLRYCIKKHIPYAIWSCGYVRPELNGVLVRIREKFLNYFDKRAAVHIAYHTSRKEYLEGKGILKESIFVAQNTIDTEVIMNSYNLDEVNANRFNDKLNVLFVGALITRKYLKETMSAVDSLISENFPMTFTIIGEGYIMDELKEYRTTLTHKKEILILGGKYGEELRSYFLSSDIFLLAGSGGLAINEAMAYGLPIISTEGDGSGRDLIKNNGYMLRQLGDEAEIKNALSNFVRLSRNEQLKMSKNSLNHINHKATLTLMIDNYQKAIQTLLNYRN